MREPCPAPPPVYFSIRPCLRTEQHCCARPGGGAALRGVRNGPRRPWGTPPPPPPRGVAGGAAASARGRGGAGPARATTAFASSIFHGQNIKCVKAPRRRRQHHSGCNSLLSSHPLSSPALSLSLWPTAYGRWPGPDKRYVPKSVPSNSYFTRPRVPSSSSSSAAGGREDTSGCESTTRDTQSQEPVRPYRPAVKGRTPSRPETPIHSI